MIRALLSVVVVATMLLPLTAYALQNRLTGHPSPYLQMHGKDPVAWQEWSDATVQKARDEKKLLFVSIGYFACHWCHVMQRESYQNREIAEILNKNFIPVKVDRELNPALDSRLIDFVEATRGYSGWPLNVFITPQGHPLVGMVYLPPTDFKTLVERLNTAWQNDAASLSRDAARAANAIVPAVMNTDPTLPEGISDRVNSSLLKALWTHADEFGGGFGAQSKFPSSPQLLALLKTYAINPDTNKRLGDFLRTTLDKMAHLGLHDLVGGGFYRYTVDPGWLVPHFEKMLYDNAQLVTIYLQAAEIFKSDKYRQLAYETLDFMIRELQQPDGSFVTSLSAIDNNNVEGGYYLYDSGTLEKTLSKAELAVVRAAWIQPGSPTTEDGHLPVWHKTAETLAKQLNKPVKDIEPLFASAKQKLFALRKQRVLPVDSKALAGWNGLALSALAQAVRHSGNKAEYVTAGNRLAAFLRDRLIHREQNNARLTLQRALDKQGRAIGDASLEDYAYVTQGLLNWAETVTPSSTDKPAKPEAYHADISMLLETAWQRYYTQNGWKLSERLLINYGASEAALADTALPSPSAVLIDTTLRFTTSIKSDKALSLRARAALNNAHDLLLGDGYWFATQIAALQQWATYRFQ